MNAHRCLVFCVKSKWLWLYSVIMLYQRVTTKRKRTQSNNNKNTTSNGERMKFKNVIDDCLTLKEYVSVSVCMYLQIFLPLLLLRLLSFSSSFFSSFLCSFICLCVCNDHVQHNDWLKQVTVCTLYVWHIKSIMIAWPNETGDETTTTKLNHWKLVVCSMLAAGSAIMHHNIVQTLTRTSTYRLIILLQICASCSNRHT